jgi:hypothetical protein
LKILKCQKKGIEKAGQKQEKTLITRRIRKINKSKKKQNKTKKRKSW